jgi:hypothetical protein
MGLASAVALGAWIAACVDRWVLRRGRDRDGDR